MVSTLSVVYSSSQERGCVSTGEGGDSGRQFEELLLDRDIGVEKDR